MISTENPVLKLEKMPILRWKLENWHIYLFTENEDSISKDYSFITEKWKAPFKLFYPSWIQPMIIWDGVVYPIQWQGDTIILDNKNVWEFKLIFIPICYEIQNHKLRIPQNIDVMIKKIIWVDEYKNAKKFFKL